MVALVVYVFVSPASLSLGLCTYFPSVQSLSVPLSFNCSSFVFLFAFEFVFECASFQAVDGTGGVFHRLFRLTLRPVDVSCEVHWA